MRYFLAVLTIASATSASAQIGTGQWRMHIPTSEAIDVAAGNGLVMAAINGGVVEYDIDAAENRILNNLNGLSDIKVSCVTYEPQSKSFFVGYENGNLDQITPNGTLNIPAIKLAQVTGSKKINKIISYNGKAYIATDFALVVIDPVKSEVRDTWYPTGGTEGVNDVTFTNDSVYVLTDSHLLRGAQSSAFLADVSQWTSDPRIPVPTDSHYGEIALRQGEIYISCHSDPFGTDSIARLTNAGLVSVIGQSWMEIVRFHIDEDLFYVYFTDALVIFNEDASVNNGVNMYNNIAAQPSKAVHYNNSYWVADAANGLVRYNGQYSFTFIQQEGPPKNRFFSLAGAKGKIIATGGTIDRVSLAFQSPDAYTFENESWTLFDQSNQVLWQSGGVRDMGVAAINPKNTNEMAIGGYCSEALSLVENGIDVSTVYTASNSLLDLTSVGNNMVCLSALEFDEDGNLWVLNCYTNQPLKVRMADGTWHQFETGTSSKNVFTSKLAIDDNGHKWFGIYGTGLVGFNDNDTPENTADDSYVTFTTGTGTGNLPSTNVTAVAVDKDNEVWIGTDDGFAILYNSEGVFSGSGTKDASRILITYDGNVEYLLANTAISDIEIDGGNRKWMGTSSSGIFLLSADGQEVIANYTKENSPLISNNIMDLEFNGITGELFIVTDVGLVSFRTDASDEDKNYETTTVFPNPVKPDYFGPVTIQGIRYDSDVKITDIAGNLVYQTTSNGGTAVWNGKTLTGEDVTSGVYLIWTATNTGKDRKVGKVAVIR